MRLIDANALKERIRKSLAVKSLDDLLPPEKCIVRQIDNMPTIEPERKMGKWIDGYKRQRCSICRYSGVRSWEYCPKCGARMEGEEDR